MRSSATRLAVAARARQRLCGRGHVAADRVALRRRGQLDGAQLRVEVVLRARRPQGADRLLPRQRDGGVGQDQQTRDDERGAERALHRRSADSVPPSEPGPA